MNKELIKEELLKYRGHMAHKNCCEPYKIFPNTTLESLLKTMPKTIYDFKFVKGFGEKRTESYGEDILAIINKGSAKLSNNFSRSNK